MIRISLQLIVFVFIFNNWVFSQSRDDSAQLDNTDRIIILFGQISDANSQETIPYAHIYIDHTSMGTVSNEGGKFEFKVPSKFIGDSIIISSIGYETIKIAIKGNSESLDIKLIPSNSMLSEVIISDKPIGGLFILNRVIDNFPKNLSYQPFNYFVYYKGKEQDSYGGKANIIEAAIKTYYDKGYSENSKKGFTIINKKEITKSMNKLTMGWPWFGLLNGEIHQNHKIWIKNKLKNYVIDIVDTVYQDDDLIYVIDYTSKKQDYKTTGYSHVKSASGSLYISRKDYAVLSHKMTFTFKGIDNKIIAENSKKKHDEISALKFQYEVS